ncbi:MAG: DUF975 family protein [Lachnospiraceae bacterium]|nr:DUF975 family protein [Lachnospiraceae bacterium]
MWTRKELKEQAKQRVRINYWKTVLAALVFAVLCSGGSSAGSIAGALSGLQDSDSYSEEVYDGNVSDSDDKEKADPYEGDYRYDPEEEIDPYFSGPAEDEVLWIFLALFLILIVVVLVVFVVALPVQIFIFHPLGVGISRFYMRNLKEKAQLKEICYNFDHGYKNCVKIEFFRHLYIFLWSLLLVIPGIIKSYEYKMIPYILGEHPEMSQEEVFALSKSMMYGNKWKAFVLALSFLGWHILNGLTLGILGIFYLNPYMNQTDAALYQVLRDQQIQEKGDCDGVYDSGCR